MNIEEFINEKNEKPLDRVVSNGGFCSIFRTIACIGDSLSSGELVAYENGSKSWHDMYEYSWGQFLARDTGCTVYNFSKGAMCAKCYDEFARERGFYDDKYKSKAYIMALGVNDLLGLHQRVGSCDDINSEDPDNRETFAYYYAKIIEKYKSKLPQSQPK